MSRFNASDRERLCSLLNEELGLFERILELCNEQTELLNKDNYSRLEASLKEVQELRGKINGLHQESDKLMQSYSSSSAYKDKDIDVTAANIQKIIEQCARLNESNMELVQLKTEEQTKKIDEQSAKRKGIGGYAQAYVSNPEMFDNKA